MAVRKFPQRSRYQEIADRLSHIAYTEVEVFITEGDVAEALGDEEYDPERDEAYQPLVKWISKRRMLGYEPCADDILHWIETEAP